MLGRVKKWLGIEGVKLEVVIPEEISESEGKVRGTLQFQSMNAQVVTEIRLVMIEKFSRGRRKEKRIDEYQLGEAVIKEKIPVGAEEIVEVPFELDFKAALSEMDVLQRQNFVFGGVISAAKFLRNVKSEYSIVAEARVKGVALNPFDRKTFKLKR